MGRNEGNWSPVSLFATYNQAHTSSLSMEKLAELTRAWLHGTV